MLSVLCLIHLCKISLCVSRISLIIQVYSRSIPAPWPSSIGFYDPKRKTIVDFGNSRACGLNHNKSSIHAEQRAIEYCRKNDKRNKYKIYIGRYAKDGHLKPAYCCRSCTQLVKKYNFEDRVFTLNNDNFVSAVTDNPTVSLAYQIKRG